MTSFPSSRGLESREAVGIRETERHLGILVNFCVSLAEYLMIAHKKKKAYLVHHFRGWKVQIAWHRSGDSIIIFWRSGKGHEPRQDLVIRIPVSGELTHPLRTSLIPYKGEATDLIISLEELGPLVLLTGKLSASRFWYTLQDSLPGVRTWGWSCEGVERHSAG